MKTWLKGGLLGLIIYFLIFLFDLVIGFDGMHDFLEIIPSLPLGIILGIYKFNLCFFISNIQTSPFICQIPNFYFYSIIYIINFLAYFIIGAIIGWIIGKIKSKK